MNGFLSILKPPGMTSFAVVSRIRHALPKGTRIGHAGTLDPQAAGVLPVMIGRATRLFDYTTDKTKTYLVEFVPGIETDTQDTTGTVVRRGRKTIEQAEIEALLPRFTGDIEQIPPMYSALKRDGKRLYELARAGETVEREPRTVHVDQIRVCFEEAGHYFLEVTCGRGTYMRTICHDLGLALGSAGCMGALIRTAAGPFTIDESMPLEALDCAEPLETLRAHLYPLDYPLSHIRRFDIDGRMSERHVRAGMPVPCTDTDLPESVPVRIYWQDRFCGLAHREGTVCIYDCMLLE